ncbi:MAG TPA: hypothetical protein VKT99_07015 [Xanthobacteraceae bacterium]|jgi:hypothetical protein|nr:hypothetical protein [Xanthobacteraceae bacterium]
MGLELAVIGVLGGIVLGLRFKVFVLAPAIALAMIFAVAGGVAHGDGWGSIVLAVIILGTAIQFGYLTGIVIHAAAGPVFASIIGSRNAQFNSQIGRT